MDKRQLNLATSPSPPFGLFRVLLATLLVLLAALSVVQVVNYQRYEKRSAEMRSEERDVRAAWESAGQELAGLQLRFGRQETAARLEEIRYLNELIARKGFSWSRMFADLEAVLPENVYLAGLRPEVDGTDIRLRMSLRGRSIGDVSRFVEALETDRKFRRLVVSFEEKPLLQTAVGVVAVDVDVEVTVGYNPGADLP